MSIRNSAFYDLVVTYVLKSCGEWRTPTNEVRLAHPRGFEPLASAFGGQRSIQLSYGCITISGADHSEMIAQAQM